MSNLLAFILLILNLFPGTLAQDYLQLDGTSSHIDGPNCWNGALYVAEVIDSKRYVDPSEWLTLLKLNCTEVQYPKEGSIGRLYSDKAEVHGFIHLSDSLIFAKHGMDVKDGYKIMSYKEMLGQYGKSRECRISGSDAPECYHHLKYYNCYRSQAMRSTLQFFGKKLEELIFSEETSKNLRETCEDSSFLKREDILSEMILLLETLSEDKKVHPFNEYEKTLLESYVTQVYEVEVSNRNYRCSHRQAKSKSTRQVRKLLKSIF